MSYEYNNKALDYTGFRLLSSTFPQLKNQKKEITVLGRNGSIFIDGNSYEDRIIECEHISTNFSEDKFNFLYDFFSKTKGELIFESNKKLKWIVKNINLESIDEEAFGKIHKFKASFICDPFRKLVNERLYEISTSSIEIPNNGINECFPNITIRPKSFKTDISMFFNGNEFKVLAVDGTKGDVKVIGDTMTVIQNNKVLKTAGVFPQLKRGMNFINGSEDYISLIVSPNENYA